MIRLENVHHMTKDKAVAKFLIDRKWPRGVIRFIPHKEKSGESRPALAPISWRPKLAPGILLSQWFYQNPEADQFRRRYFRELRKREKEWGPIVVQMNKGDIALLYHDDGLSLVAAKAFKEFLELELKLNKSPDAINSRRKARLGRGVVVPSIEKILSRKRRLPLKPKNSKEAQP